MGTKIRPFNLHTSVDSHVKGLIDSDYVQARSGSGGTDSASTQAMIDSNFENSITFGNDVTFDSSGGVLFDKSDQSLKFGDNIPIKFGNDGDLLIRHEASGSHSVIRESGAGTLFIDASDLQLRSGDFQKYAVFTLNGSAELYHDNSKKFETTSGGATVTGDLEILSTDAGASEDPNLVLYRNSSSPADADQIGTIQFKGRNDNTQDVVYGEIQSAIQDASDGVEESSLNLQVRKDGSATTFLNLSGASGRVNIQQELFLTTGVSMRFEGATANDHEIAFTVTDPTADRTITLPDATGDVVLNESGAVNISSTADNGPQINIRSNDHADAGNFNTEGSINFFADNDADQETMFAQILMATGDITDGAEDGWIYIYNTINGSSVVNAGFGDGNLVLHDDDAKIEFWQQGGTSYSINLNAATPSATRTVTLPDATGTIALTSDISVTASSTTTFTNKTLTSPAINAGTLSGAFTGTADLTGLVLSGASPLVFEGSTDNANETSLAVQNPTADRTITLPNITGRINELLITEGSFNSTSLAFNSSTLTNEFSEFRLVISNARPSTATNVRMRVGSSNSADTGSNYGQAIYYTGYYGSATAYTVSGVANAQAYFEVCGGFASLGTGTGQNGHFEITVLNPTSSYYKFFKFNTQLYSYYPMLMGRSADAQVWQSTAAINYLQVYPVSGNLSGTYQLYGTRAY